MDVELVRRMNPEFPLYHELEFYIIKKNLAKIINYVVKSYMISLTERISDVDRLDIFMDVFTLVGKTFLRKEANHTCM